MGDAERGDGGSREGEGREAGDGGRRRGQGSVQAGYFGEGGKSLGRSKDTWRIFWRDRNGAIREDRTVCSSRLNYRGAARPLDGHSNSHEDNSQL